MNGNTKNQNLRTAEQTVNEVSRIAQGGTFLSS